MLVGVMVFQFDLRKEPESALVKNAGHVRADTDLGTNFRIQFL